MIVLTRLDVSSGSYRKGEHGTPSRETGLYLHESDPEHTYDSDPNGDEEGDSEGTDVSSRVSFVKVPVKVISGYLCG